jgi:hypothetical protein
MTQKYKCIKFLSEFSWYYNTEEGAQTFELSPGKKKKSLVLQFIIRCYLSSAKITISVNKINILF